MITGSTGSPSVATMAAFPAVVLPVTGPSVYIGTWAYASRNKLEAYVWCDSLLGSFTFRAYLPVTLVSPEALNFVWKWFLWG